MQPTPESLLHDFERAVQRQTIMAKRHNDKHEQPLITCHCYKDFDEAFKATQALRIKLLYKLGVTQ